MFLTSFTSFSTSFFSVNHPLSLSIVFDAISSNIDEVLSINSSANVFAFGDFNVHHKDLLTNSSGTNRSQITLLRLLIFLPGSLNK